MNTTLPCVSLRQASKQADAVAVDRPQAMFELNNASRIRFSLATLLGGREMGFLNGVP